MKRFALFLIITTLLISTYTTGVFAASSGTGTPAQKKVMFYLKPDISIELNGSRQVFKDANGKFVSPIVYNGTVYLPIRAISSIMKEPIEWDAGSKTIYIGRTLTYPVKSEAQISAQYAGAADQNDIASINELPMGMVTGYSKPDIFVMYDFVIQIFKDTNGITIYPLSYNGSTYLPIRAVSRLMNEPITWDGTAKLVSIGDDAEEETPEDPEENEDELDQQDEEEPDDQNEDLVDGQNGDLDDDQNGDLDDDQNGDLDEASDSDITTEPGVQNEDEMDDTVRLQLKDIYEREEALYYEASAKITNIRKASAEEKEAIAASASDNYLKAQAMTEEAKKIDQKDFTEQEKAASNKLITFAESNEYYILVLENIAYLAAEDSDYSMLADTFLYFAIEAQNAMRAAKELIIVQ